MLIGMFKKSISTTGVRFIAINDNYDSETANITDTHLCITGKILC